MVETEKYNQQEECPTRCETFGLLARQRFDCFNSMNNFQQVNPWRALWKCRRLFVQDSAAKY